MALLEVLLLAFTLSAAIFLSPEPLVVRLPANASQWMLGAAPQFPEGIVYGLTVGGKGTEQMKALPSTLETARQKAHQAAEDISYAADAIREALYMAQFGAGLGRTDRVAEAQESAWKRAFEGAERTNEKAQDMAGSVEETARATGRIARYPITGPTLQALEKAAEVAASAKQKAQHMADAAKETAQSSIDAVGHTVSGVVGKVSDNVKKTGHAAWEKVAGVGEIAWEMEEAARKGIQSTGHAAWETVAGVGEAVWEMEEAVRQNAIRAGHAFWHKICQAEEAALDKVCQMEGAAKRAGATVFHRSAAVVHCIKQEAFRPEEIKALQGKVEWCEDVGEEAGHRLSSSSGDFFRVLQSSASQESGELEHIAWKEQLAKQKNRASEEWAGAGEKARDILHSSGEKAREVSQQAAEAAGKGYEAMRSGKASDIYAGAKDRVYKAGQEVEQGIEIAGEKVTGRPESDVFAKAARNAEETGEKVTEPMHSATKKGKEIYDEAKGAAAYAYEKAKDQAEGRAGHSAVESARSRAADAYERAKEWAETLGDAGRETLETAKGRASRVGEGVQNVVERAKGMAAGKADMERAKERPSKGTGEAHSAGQKGYRIASDAFQDYADKASELQPAIGEAGEKLSEIAQHAREQLKAKAGPVSEVAKRNSWLHLPGKIFSGGRSQQGWEGPDSSRSTKSIVYPMLWIGLQRLAYLGAFAIALGSLFSAMFVVGPSLAELMPEECISPARDKLLQACSKIVSICAAICLGVTIQQWCALHEESNMWQLFTLGAALSASSLNWLLVHPFLQKVRERRDEIEKDEPALSSNNGDIPTSSADKAAPPDLGAAFHLNAGPSAEMHSPAEEPASPNLQGVQGTEDESPLLSPPSRERTSLLGPASMKYPLLRKHQLADTNEKLKILQGACVLANWTTLLGLTWHLWHLACHLAL